MTEKLKEFSELIDQQRPHEAFVLLLEQVENKSWVELSTLDLAMLDMLCQQALPQLREDHTLWMVNHPVQLRRMLQLLTEALAVNYHPAATIEHITWLRCLLAIEAAMTGQLERVHKELCLVQQEGSIPKPNGRLRRQVQCIQLREKSTIEFLDPFFQSYLEFLRRVGKYEFCNQLENRITPLLKHMARDEKRPGVVRAMFYDKLKGEGHLRFIHVSTEYLSDSNDTDKTSSKKAILYTGKKDDIIDATMQEAVNCAWQTVDMYLKRVGYPDGLARRLVRWQIADPKGDSAEFERRFQGGSLGLPLAVAIVSQYLAKPVPNDTAFTGAFTVASTANGRILPVDGVPEKVRQAVQSACQLIYVPAANAAELKNTAGLQNLIQKNNSKVITAETIDEVCGELFPPESSGQLKDTIRDTWSNFLQILHPVGYTRKHTLAKPIHERHRTHVVICSLLTAILVFLEGWRIYKASAPQYLSITAWVNIHVSAVIVFVGMCICFALPAACLRHRKVWSWYAGIAVLAVCFGVGLFLLGPMLPDFAHISSIYNAPPVAGMVKDMFVIWIFAWAIAANTFNAVAALEDLVAKRQFVTARLCLKWDSPLEGRMPLRCIHFPWEWGLLCIAVVAAYLIVLDLNYYSSLDSGTASAYWETLLGLGRDLVFIAAIAEVIVFYRTAIATIRKALA